jgi:pimeloyl-ACP methyl ester carboxylesterase
MTTMQRVPPGDIAAWQREWTATADRVAAIGDGCAKRGHQVSAREAYLRASNYYRTSYVMHFGAPVAPEVRNGFARESATFRAFAERMNPSIEPVEIPYEGTTLPGYFCRALGVSGRARTLVVTNGYDSTLHELYFAFAVAANRRGYHCLIFDGPGQGRVLIEQNIPMRHDWENVVRPVLNYLLARPEVDPGRVVIAGWSLGGYLALRGTVGENRLAACAADPGLSSLLGPMRKMLSQFPPDVLANPLKADPNIFAPFMAKIESSFEQRWKVVQRAFWVHGVRSLPEYLDAARRFTIENSLQAIRCPVFLGWAEEDQLSVTAPELQQSIPARKSLVRFLTAEGAGDHCELSGRSLLHQRMFDWLDEILA